VKRALIIVDHGSRLEEANRMLERLAGHLRRLSGQAVHVAHMELAEPSIAQAFDAAVAGGAEFVFVFPCLVAPGRHSRRDIPAQCAAAAARHPGLKWHCSGPIGADEMLARLILDRLERCAAGDYRCEDCPDFPECREEPGDAPARPAE